METLLLLRNGEQLLLTLIIPTLLLVLGGTLPIIDVGAGARIDFVAPGVLALAVMSTAFTGQAIATGFERRYDVLKRLGATPMPRWALLAGKTAAVLAVEVLQITVLVAVALALGWSPATSATGLAACLLLLLLGTAAFSGLGLLLAGTLRAEATLAAANLVYVLLLVAGDVIVSVTAFPEAVRPLLEALPLTALAGGLRDVLTGGPTPWVAIGVLAGWAVAGCAAAAALFRWE